MAVAAKQLDKLQTRVRVATADVKSPLREVRCDRQRNPKREEDWGGCVQQLQAAWQEQLCYMALRCGILSLERHL